MLESDAVEKLHGDKCLAVFISDVVNRANVGMAESRGGLGLAAKTLERLAVMGYIVREKLERDEAAEARVFGLIDDTHATAAKLFDDAVVGDGLADHCHSSIVMR